jgi:hypothetical protein
VDERRWRFAGSPDDLAFKYLASFRELGQFILQRARRHAVGDRRRQPLEPLLDALQVVVLARPGRPVRRPPQRIRPENR